MKNLRAKLAATNRKNLLENYKKSVAVIKCYRKTEFRFMISAPKSPRNTLQVL